MKMPIDDEIKRLQVQCFTMLNFVLAAAIVGGIVYTIYRLGLLIWG